jgi:hypothetical protein
MADRSIHKGGLLQRCSISLFRFFSGLGHADGAGELGGPPAVWTRTAGNRREPRGFAASPVPSRPIAWLVGTLKISNADVGRYCIATVTFVSQVMSTKSPTLTMSSTVGSTALRLYFDPFGPSGPAQGYRDGSGGAGGGGGGLVTTGGGGGC